MDNENLTKNNAIINESESTVQENSSTQEGNLTLPVEQSVLGISNNRHNTISDVPDEADTAICEYLDIVKSEYEIERSKKESFENRSGIILALIGALFVFVIDKVLVSDVIALFSVNLNFIVFLQIIFGIGVYLSLAYTIFNVFVTLSTRKQENFNVESIDMSLLKECRVNALARLILAYRGIIIKHRAINEKRAKAYKNSLYGSIASIISVVIYLSIK